jgi:murein DD-endopeptidase MepM/ murein hydrolase activator NlpD
MLKSENSKTYIQEANSAETVILQGGLEITRNADGTFYYPDQIAEICNANNISIASLFEAAGGTVQNPTLQENSGQLPTIEAVEGAFPELGIGKKTKSTYDDPRLQDVGDNTYLSRDDLSNPPVRKTRNITAERPTSQVATELVKNTGGVIVNSSILAFRLAFESGKAARYAYHNTNEFVKKYTTNTIRLTLLATAATTSAALIWNATHPNKPNTESGQVVLSDKFLHPMKDGAVYNSAKVENRTITINGVTKTRPHRGIDSALSPEEIRYIRASRSGVITNISTNGEGSSGGYGTLIEIDTVESVAGTFDGLGYRNAHLDISDKWKVGDRINQGDIIGTMANHGRGTGPHDHFEILNRTNDKVTIGNLKTKLKGASAQMGKKISEGKIGNSHYSVWQPTKPKLEIKLDKIIPDPSQHLNPCDVIEGGCPVLKSRFSKPEYINAKTLDSKTQTAKK